jgi:hypothetical protein
MDMDEFQQYSGQTPMTMPLETPLTTLPNGGFDLDTMQFHASSYRSDQGYPSQQQPFYPTVPHLAGDAQLGQDPFYQDPAVPYYTGQDQTGQLQPNDYPTVPYISHQDQCTRVQPHQTQFGLSVSQSAVQGRYHPNQSGYVEHGFGGQYQNANRESSRGGMDAAQYPQNGNVLCQYNQPQYYTGQSSTVYTSPSYNLPSSVASGYPNANVNNQDPFSQNVVHGVPPSQSTAPVQGSTAPVPASSGSNDSTAATGKPVTGPHTGRKDRKNGFQNPRGGAGAYKKNRHIPRVHKMVLTDDYNQKNGWIDSTATKSHTCPYEGCSDKGNPGHPYTCRDRYVLGKHICSVSSPSSLGLMSASMLTSG